jgi:hypothetical protein
VLLTSGEGAGSDRRRKKLITEAFGSELLFHRYRKACRTEFERIATALQDSIDTVIKQQFLHLNVDLQVLKTDNAILEAEQDPAFRERVVAQLAFVRKEMLERVYDPTPYWCST